MLNIDESYQCNGLMIIITPNNIEQQKTYFVQNHQRKKMVHFKL